MRKQEARLTISELTAIDIAVSSDEGDKINERIEHLLQEYEVIIIDFKDITLLTTAFLNAAIGQLYKNHTSEELSKRLKLENVSDDDLAKFKSVTDRAKEYFSNPDQFNQSVNKTLRGE